MGLFNSDIDNQMEHQALLYFYVSGEKLVCYVQMMSLSISRAQFLRKIEMLVAE